MIIDEKITNEIERAISRYNTAIKILTANYTNKNESRAHGELKYLRGLCNMLYITTSLIVTFEYLDNAFYSEIVNYNVTLAVKK